MKLFDLPDYMKQFIETSNEAYKQHLIDKANKKLIDDTSVQPSLPHWVFLHRSMVPYSDREGFYS